MENCKECSRGISTTEFTANNGLCTKCYLLKSKDMEEKNTSNKVAVILKATSVICAIGGFILGLIQLDSYKNKEVCGIYIAIGLVSALFIYAFGEVVQLLEDIKNK